MNCPSPFPARARPAPGPQLAARLCYNGGMVTKTVGEKTRLATEQPAAVPRLENGDHLTRVEFERRYAAAPHIKKAELIEGVVHVPSPVSLAHSSYHATLIGWLLQYRAATKGVRLLDNATIILDRENEVQPDAALCIAEGGQTRRANEFLAGAPELVVEVAASSASYDLHDKLRVYRRNGVQEYVVLLALEQQTVWYRLNEGRYDELPPDADGIYRSEAFPGLWLHAQAFWADDLPALMATLQAGLAAPEHAAFVAALSSTQA